MKKSIKLSNEQQQIIIYQTEDGRTKIDVRLENETVWLSQMQMAELFNTTVPNINIHIKNVYADNELSPNATIKDYLIVQTEGKRQVSREVTYYNLDMIIAVGYRVKSLRSTQFRQWATNILSEYIRKGFAINDELLKKAGGGGYWKELLARIRDIRSSEKVFYRQILDIYATSMDYSPKASETLEFFRIVQNKMHYAAHEHTAAELIYQRANSTKPFMGLTSFTGLRPKKEDVTVAKNYLDEKELDYLNRITSLCLDFAEFQALEQKSMLMKDWIVKLDEFLKANGREILDSAGTVSKKQADDKALAEYEKYKEITVGELSEVEKHYFENIKVVQKELEKKGSLK